MEPVGFAFSVVSLVKTAKGLYKSIKRLQLNAERRRHLTELVDRLVQVLGTAGSTSDAAAAFVSMSVQEVKSTLESLAESSGRRHGFLKFVSGCIAAPGEADELDKAQRKLESLTTQVVVVTSILQLKESPRIFNERMELPPSLVGLDRAKPILDFLHASSSEQLRAIGIHGLPGVGKTTLLSYIWQEVSFTAPFAAQAHVQVGNMQVGDNATSRICNLQSGILRQLGSEHTEFTSPEGGKQKLREHFQQLRGSKKPVFLAIDNVFEAEDLQKLLPFDLLEVLPASSSIAMTCRDYRVVEALLNICCLQKENRSQVFCFSPLCLGLEESREVFASCGKLCIVEDAELLESLVPLCEGLPLALTILGKLFAGGARRKREEWEDIMEQMQVLDGDGTETKAITKSLRVSFDQLPERCKAAFLDVVHCFYGWPWGRVERILGVSVLNDLKNSSLISEVDGWEKCNQNALKVGHDMDGHYAEDMSHDLLTERVVTMHDLTLKFGESLRSLPVTIQAGWEILLQNLEAPKVRNLLWGGDPEIYSKLDFLEKTTSLQTLLLCTSRKHYGYYNTSIFKANYHANVSAAPYSSRGGGLQPALRFLKLKGCTSSRVIMEMKLSREI